MTDEHAISLTLLPAELTRHGVSVRYRHLYRDALDGKIPAFKVGDRWCVKRADLGDIAATYGNRAAA